MITVDGVTRTARDLGARIYKKLSIAFIKLAEVEEILEAITPIEKLNKTFPDEAKCRLLDINLTINIIEGLQALDDKSYGWTDLLRHATFIVMDLKVMKQDILLKYDLRE